MKTTIWFSFRQRCRKEITRRAFVVGGIAAGVGIAVLPFLPWGGDKPDAKRLLDPDIAKADPQLIRQLCLLYHTHPDVKIRRACAGFSGSFDDTAMRDAHWTMATDSDLQVKSSAVRAILMREDPNEIPKIVSLYRGDSEIRPAIDQVINVVGLTALKQAIEGP